MGLFNNSIPLEEGEIAYYNVIHVSGLSLSNARCILHLFNDKLIIEVSDKGNNRFMIPKDNLRKSAIEVGEAVYEKNKSAVGRAAVGGLLFGPVGAVVGGISGTQKKVVKYPENFLIITYINSNGNEDEVRFKMGSYNKTGIDEFAKEIDNVIFEYKSEDGIITL